MRKLRRIFLLISGCALASVISSMAYAVTINSPTDPALSGATYWGFEELSLVSGNNTASIVDPSGQVTFDPWATSSYAVVNFSGQYDQVSYRQIRTWSDFSSYPANVTEEYRFIFASPVTAFGFSLGQINESGWTAQVFDSANTFIEGVSWPAICCNQYFRGIAASDILSIRLIFTGNYDDVTIDNFYFNSSATVVPLPAALPLFGTGVGIMGLFGWLRRRRAAAV